MIYLVHFARPYKHAKHYLGFTDLTLVQRFKRHTSLAAIRQGSALMRAVMLANITFKVVRTWPGDRTRERQLKDRGHARKCPVCCGRVSYNDAVCMLKAEGS